MQPVPRIAVIMTCFNRASHTRACLQSLARQAGDAELSVFAVDDGSTDDTPAVLRESPLPVTVIGGDGQLFWAAGMSLAERAALASGDHDALLWLNDDVDLNDDAVQTLVEAAGGASGLEDLIVVGRVAGGAGETSYGPMVQDPGNPLRIVLAPPTAVADTFHGNVVLVGRRARAKVGAIDGAYQHAYADIDYGLRCRDLGIPILTTATPVGRCEFNDIRARMFSRHVPLRQRVNAALDRRGMPPRDQLRFCRRHAGRWWPYWFVRSYAGVLLPFGVRSDRPD